MGVSFINSIFLVYKSKLYVKSVKFFNFMSVFGDKIMIKTIVKVI